MYKFTSPGTGTITAYGTVLTIIGNNTVVTPVGDTTMTPLYVNMPIPGPFFPYFTFPMYVGHTGTLTTSQPATDFDGTYKDAMNQIHAISVTGTLVP